MGFQEIIGQDKIIQYLKHIIFKNRIGHGYIFDGPAGIGKEAMARAFAQAIDCKSSLHGEPCGRCSSCVKFQSNNHPDIKMIEPEGNSIKNKQIEELQQDVSVKPYESRKKIYIIKDAHEMTVSAQNRLLKTLEEPPSYTLMIFLTTNANSLLPTIKSRCQILKFQRVSDQAIMDFLIKKYEINPEEAKLLSAFSNGIIDKAIQLRESEEFKVRREQTIEIIEELIKSDTLKIFSLVDFFEKNKENIYDILDLILFWFRDLMIWKETGKDGFLINLDKKLMIEQQGNRIGYEDISHIIEIIEKTKSNIKSNVNFQLAIEMLLINIQEVSNGNSSRSKI